MSKTFKEQSLYNYLHDNGSISYKQKHVLKNKFRHHCNDAREAKEIKAKTVEEQLDKDLNVDLINYYNEKECK